MEAAVRRDGAVDTNPRHGLRAFALVDDELRIQLPGFDVVQPDVIQVPAVVEQIEAAAVIAQRVETEVAAELDLLWRLPEIAVDEREAACRLVVAAKRQPAAVRR